MHALIRSGDLQREDIEYYMAYTAMVFDFVPKYEWQSVLDYDYLYREQQSSAGFKWGCISPLMELQILIPKGQPKSKPQNPNQSKQLCRQWAATGRCRFGQQCRYSHISRETTPEDVSKKNRGSQL